MHDDVGIRATELSDEDLLREVTHLHETRHDTFLGGSAAAMTNHTDRMLELESEFARRHPESVASDDRRQREGSRLLAGQD
ncbi:MAG: hypothetical protein QOG52_2722 [Frankiaceae bacterium]|jgi:hypothetical protein|nr:hypothetical protein [Frankiaceae bacterium]MDQ1725694.1 hypothetical protein [Frankiaceae bacterium]